MSTEPFNIADAVHEGKQAIEDASLDELKRHIAKIEEENLKLQRNGEYRSKFLARLAHELRTPLTSILGFSEILIGQERLTKAQRGFCQRIQNSAKQLQFTLNQLADLSRLESGSSELAKEEFSLDDVVREACAALERPASKQNVKLNYKTHSPLAVITSDRNKLAQVIYNFLAYAIARSPESAPVIVTAEKTAGGFEIVIQDEGEPLDDPSSFETESLPSHAGSSELGLAIARQNALLLGGKIAIENRRSRGMQVSIKLPAVSPDALAQ